MLTRAVLALLGFLAMASPALAQSQTQTMPWNPVGPSVTLSVTSASSNVQLGWVGQQPSAPVAAYVCNTGTADAFVNFGATNAVTAATTNFKISSNASGGLPNCILMALNGASFIAGITSVNPTTLTISTGNGSPVGGLGTGTGGSGAVLPGTAGQVAYYASTGSTVSGSPVLSLTSSAMQLFNGATQVGSWDNNGRQAWYTSGGVNRMAFGYTTSTFGLTSGMAFGWTSSSTDATGSPDTILTRQAASTIHHGAADAASPVAQTLGVQGVVAGTSNTSGATFTIAGSQSTGTGVGGSIVFQVSTAGGAGSAQNAFVTAMTIEANPVATTAFGTGNTAVLTPSTNTNQAGFRADSAQAFWFAGRSVIQSTADGNLRFSTNNIGNTFDISFPASNTLHLGLADAASPVAQTLGVQGVVAGNANTAAANFTITGGLSNGSGGGDLIFQTTLSSAGSGVQNTGATALTLKGGNQEVIFSAALAGSANGVALNWDNSAQVKLASTGVMAWGPSTVNAGTADTGFSRTGAAAVALGNGSANDFSGTLKLANLIADKNTGTVPTVIDAGTVMQLVAADTNSTRLEQYAAGSTGQVPSHAMFLARNTIASPQAIQSADVGGQYVMGGYDGSAYANGARMRGIATETWTNGPLHGMKLEFDTVPNASGTLTAALTLDQDQSTTFGGAMTNTHLSTGTNADVVCLSAGGLFLIQANASCTISSIRFKNMAPDQDPTPADALLAVMRLRPVAFTMKEDLDHLNPDRNFARLQVGFTAENVAAVDRRLAIYEQDMITPKAYRENAVLAMTVGGLQYVAERQNNDEAILSDHQRLIAQHQKAIDDLREEIATLRH